MLKHIMKHKCNSKKSMYVDGGCWSKVGEGILRGAIYLSKLGGGRRLHSFTDSSLGAFRI
jgi:hypothetical protein